MVVSINYSDYIITNNPNTQRFLLGLSPITSGLLRSYKLNIGNKNKFILFE